MEDESAIQMDTNYVLEKIQNIKGENATLKQRLEQIQTTYQTLEKTKKWKDQNLEYVFVTPLNHLKARRKFPTTVLNLEEHKKLAQMSSNKKENLSGLGKTIGNNLVEEKRTIQSNSILKEEIMKNNLMNKEEIKENNLNKEEIKKNNLNKEEEIKENNMNKEDKIESNSDERNHSSHSSSDDLHLKSLNSDENCVSNDPSSVHTEEKSVKCLSSKVPSRDFKNKTSQATLDYDEESENSQNFLSKESCSSSKNSDLESLSDNGNFDSNDVCSEEENIQDTPTKESEPPLNFENKRNQISLNSDVEDENAQSIHPKKNASSVNSNEKFSVLKCSSKKRKKTAIVPSRKSPRLLFSKNTNILPAENSTLTKCSNKYKPDPSLGTGVSLTPKANNSFKRVLSKISTSDFEENSVLPDLDDSIFEEMIEDNVVIDKSAKEKKSKKPFNSYVRKMGDSVPQPIEKSLKALEKTDISDKNIYPVAYRLVKTLIEEIDNLECEDSSSKMRLILYFILKYLTVTYLKPVFDFKKTQDTSVLLPRTELCIVYALRRMESNAYKGIFSSMVFTIYQLVLAMPSLPIFGGCAMIRILTKICMLKNNPRIPLDLCCDLLKRKHKFSTMLIASVVGVWPELLTAPVNATEEEIVYLRTVGFFCKMWPESDHSNLYKVGLTQNEWMASKELLDKFVPSSDFNPENTVKFLMKSIKKHCLDESYSKEYMLTDPLVILANCKGWYWAKENVINKHLVPNLCNFVDSDRNERCLKVFCKLYAEICCRYPEMSHPEELLYKIFHAGMENEDDKYMQDASAEALIQLLLARKEELDDSLEKWYEENKDNRKFPLAELIFFRTKIKKEILFTDEHMHIKTDLFL